MKRRPNPLALMATAAFAATLTAVLAAPVPAIGAARTHVDRVSVADDGSQVDGGGEGSAVSADGRYVAFSSAAPNLVPGDTNGAWDVFVRDRVAGTTQRVSVNSDGAQFPKLSYSPSISVDGRYVTFESALANVNSPDDHAYGIFVHDCVTGATRPVSVDRAGRPARGTHASISADGRYVAFTSMENLVRRDRNTRADFDVYLRDLQTGRTRLLSKTRFHGNGGQLADSPSISAHGRYVAFQSTAGLIPGDTNNTRDIYVRDTVRNTIRRVSVTSRGKQANHDSMGPSISAHGRYVAFGSYATNLARHDTNGTWDAFVHDRRTGKTRRVSFGHHWRQANGPSAAAGMSPAVSANGRFVAFSSTATNLVRGDHNGTIDVFLRDRARRTTRLVSRSTDAQSGDGRSFLDSMSADGQHLTFSSGADNLVPDDTNGAGDVFLFRRGS
jgi:Tol biopolymer transport system component